MALALSIDALTAFVAVIIIIASSLPLRIVIITLRCIHKNRRDRRRRQFEKDKRGDSASLLHTTDDDSLRPSSSLTTTMTFKTVAFLGSGGHTTEMIQLLQQLDHTVYTPIVYFVSKSDVTSIPRLQRYILSSDGGAVKGGDRGSSWHRWEGRCPDDTSANKQMKLMDNGATITSTSDNNNSNNNNNKLKTNNAQVYFLPRAREVHQSYISSIFTTIYSAYETIQLLWKIQPNLIVTNGPGTCVPIIYCAFILRCLFSLVDMDRRSSSSSKNILFRTIFVESLCRVKTLSLSGKLVYPIVDSFVVHWPSLMERYGMVEICDVFVPSLDS